MQQFLIFSFIFGPVSSFASRKSVLRRGVRSNTKVLIAVIAWPTTQGWVSGCSGYYHPLHPSVTTTNIHSGYQLAETLSSVFSLYLSIFVGSGSLWLYLADDRRFLRPTIIYPPAPPTPSLAAIKWSRNCDDFMHTERLATVFCPGIPLGYKKVDAEKYALI